MQNGDAPEGDHVRRGKQLSLHLPTSQVIKRRRGENSGLHYVFCKGRMVVGEHQRHPSCSIDSFKGMIAAHLH